MWKWCRTPNTKRAEQRWQAQLPQVTDEQREAAGREPSRAAIELARAWPCATAYSACFGDYVCETCLRVAKVIDAFGPQWTEALIFDLMNLTEQAASFKQQNKLVATLKGARGRADVYSHYLTHGRVYGAVNYLGGHGYSVPLTVDQQPAVDAVDPHVGSSTE